MRKSKAVNLSLAKETTSDDADYCDDPNLPGDFSDESETPHVFCRTIQQQLAQFKMQDFELTKISGLPPITDKEFNISQINSPFLPESDPASVSIECVYTMLAGSNYFPLLSSDYQKMHPSIYLWRDVRNVLETEFKTYAQNYFKEHYTSIKTHLRFFHQINPTVESLNNVSNARRDIPNGSILYHYIGYGFLTINESNISCFDKNTGNYMLYPLGKLFESIKPPVFFVFDCSNAASVIPCIERTAHFKKNQLQQGIIVKEQFVTRTIDWDDWFCICATNVGESLPSDPHLPHDFLTSCIFTPIKTAIVCHTLQFYRSSIVTNNFPLDCSDNPLFIKDSPVSIALEHALSAIVDAIAAESLPTELYRKLFKKDPFITLLFKRILLAQYLLKPFQIHPVSHLELPDLSIHPLWLHWKMIIDIVVSKNLATSNSLSNSNASNDDSFTENLFIRSLQSVTGFLKSHQESEIPPSLITLLFYFPQKSQMLPSVYSTLAQYASFSPETRAILSKSAVFISLFNALVSNNFSVDVLHNLCFLIISLIKTNPKFIHNISKFSMGDFPNKLFDPKIPSQTKSLIAVIISTLISVNESIRCFVISNQFLTRIKTLLETSDTILSLWLIILIRRIFDSYGYKLEIMYNLALHIQLSTFVHHNSYEVRAAALSAISCMLQPSEDSVNQQLFCLIFFTAFDPSFLVRYNFILLLGRFLLIYNSYLYKALNNMNENIDMMNENGNDSQSDSRNQNEINNNKGENRSTASNQSINGSFRHQSFSTLMNMLFKTNVQNENKPFSFKFLASIASSGASIEKLVSIGIYLNELMIQDPHPAIVSTANEIKSFIIRCSQSRSNSNSQFQQKNSYSTDDDGFSHPVLKNNSNGFGFMKSTKGTTNNSFNDGNINKITNMSTFVTSTISNDEISNLANSDSSTTVESLINSSRKKNSLYNYDSDSNTSASFSASNSVTDLGPDGFHLMIPESGGDALFKICLNQIVNSGNWRITESQSPHGANLFPQAPLSIAPSMKLTTRKVISSKIGRPTNIAYDATSLSFSYATDEGCVAFYNEQNEHFTSISLGSHVTTLKIGDWNQQPLVLVGTDDGSIYIWDPTRKTPRISFRADWPGKKSSVFSMRSIQTDNSIIDTTIGQNHNNCSSSMNELASLMNNNISSSTATTTINSGMNQNNASQNIDSFYQATKATSMQPLDNSTMMTIGTNAVGDTFSSASGSSYGLFNPSSFLPSSSSPPSFSPSQHSPDSSNTQQQQNQNFLSPQQVGINSPQQTKDFLIQSPTSSHEQQQQQHHQQQQQQLQHLQQQIPTSSSVVFVHPHMPSKNNSRSMSFNNNNNNNSNSLKNQNQNKYPNLLPVVSSSPPLVFSIVPGRNQIVSSRGNNGIVRLWDIDCQKLVAEFSAGAKDAVTAIAMNPFSADSCVTGFRNGRIVQLDIRCSSDENEQKGRRILQNVAAPRANEEIFRIVGNMENNNIQNSKNEGRNPMFVAATRNGSCLKWSNLDNCNVMSLKEKAPIVDFDAHLLSPLIVFSPLNSPPIMTDFDGNIIHTLKNVGNGAVCTFHPALPMVAFGTENGEIVSCELTT